MASAVLDASALMALIREERGADVVAQRVDGARVLSVNLAEVVSKLLDRGFPPPVVQSIVGALSIVNEPADRDLAWRAGLLRPATRALGLSLGDRFCLALAQRDGLPVLTADKAWAGLDLDIEVVLIR